MANTKAFAEQPSSKKEIDELMELSLEDLLSLEVEVASVDQENLKQTSTIVSRYETKDLMQIGLSNIAEAIHFIPNVRVVRSANGRFNVVSRGLFNKFEQRILLMIDKVPYYNFSHSLVPLFSVPLDAIERIEVIRGPGLELHGHNSSSGVINFVTKKQDKNILKGVIGSNKDSESYGYFKTPLGKDGDVFVAVSKLEGESIKSQIDRGVTSGTPGEFDLNFGAESLLTRINYGNTIFLFNAFQTKSIGIDGQYDADSSNINREQGLLFYLGHNFEFKNGSLRLFFDHNFYDYNYKIENQTGAKQTLNYHFNIPKDNSHSRIGSLAQVNLASRLSWVVGMDLESVSIGDFIVQNESTQSSSKAISAQRFSEQDIFSQLEYSWDDWRFRVGGRAIFSQNSGNNFSPNFSTFYDLDKNQTFKLLFSSGVSTPNGIQTLYSYGNEIENNDLKDEKIQSLDLVYTYSSNSYLFSLNWYWSNVENGIQQETVGLNKQWTNNESFHRKGFELDYQLKLYNWNAFINTAYLDGAGKFSSTDRSIAYTPNIELNLGASYDINFNHEVGASLNTHTSREIDSSGKILYGRNTLNIYYEYSRKSLVWHFAVKNALDQVIREPDIINQSGSTFISQEGVGFKTGLEYKF